ncbi:hypothetical protein CVT25_011755 [Psilocybe cyanescens]|uniref:FAD-binding domain-containing protein n=1 Tax=Psilocybe cyanescens TaxID=93625 RepID=A0A409WIE6_PSICY|nr:hypothetical protein CVT25_011755 [Psilocybe cyanescens]
MPAGPNTGVQDSYNLGWKLVLVSKGFSHLDHLKSYTEERIPVVSEMLGLITALLNKISQDSTVEDSWKRSSAVNQLGINYRGSSIVLDEADTECARQAFNGPTQHAVVIFADIVSYRSALKTTENYTSAGMVTPILITKRGGFTSEVITNFDLCEDRDGHAYEA